MALWSSVGIEEGVFIYYSHDEGCLLRIRRVSV